MKELISVIIPTYQRLPQLIARSIESALNQTYEQLEIIVVDDSPRDYEGRPVVKEYIESLADDRLLYLQHDDNLGANKARNTGIEHSSGKYLTFLDDDDEWALDKIERQYQKFIEWPHQRPLGLVYCDATFWNEETGESRPTFLSYYRGEVYPQLLKQNFIGSNSYVMIPRAILDEIGYYDETLRSHQDYDLFLRIARKYSVDYVNKSLVNYYIHSGERITTNPHNQLQGRLSIYHRLVNEIRQDPEINHIWKLKLVPMYYRAGKNGKAIIELVKLLSQHPLLTVKYLLNTYRYWQKTR